MFPVEKDVFLLFPVGEEWFSRFMRIPSGIFSRCKIDEILTHFTLDSPYDFAYLVFFRSSQPSAQMFAKHGFACVKSALKRTDVPTFIKIVEIMLNSDNLSAVAVIDNEDLFNVS